LSPAGVRIVVEHLAVRELDEADLTERDVVVGLAVSARTPYVIGALRHARLVGAATVAVSCNRDAAISCS